MISIFTLSIFVNNRLTFTQHFPIVYVCNMFELTFLLATFVTHLYRIMNRRLQQFLTAENISQSQFAESIGVARANVSHILSGRNKPGFDFIEKMLTAYPALNVDWLITGKGKMYRNSYAGSGVNSREEVNLFNSTSPAYDSELFSHPEQDDYAQQEHVEVFQSAMNYSGDAESLTSPNGPAYQEKASEPASKQTGFNERSTVKRQGQRISRSEINTLGNISNQLNSQRVITKIIVYYSDNTYQELK